MNENEKYIGKVGRTMTWTTMSPEYSQYIIRPGSIIEVYCTKYTTIANGKKHPYLFYQYDEFGKEVRAFHDYDFEWLNRSIEVKLKLL